MNITHIDSSRPAWNGNNSSDSAIDRALGLLVAGGFSFDIVDRCPSECAFCDEALPNAA